MATTRGDKKNAEAELGLRTICLRYIKAAGLQPSDTTPVGQICKALQEVVRSKPQLSAQKFIDRCYQPINLAAVSASKPIWSLMQEQAGTIEATRKKNKHWERFKSFLVIVGAIFFGATAIAARVRTGGGNPFRLLQDKSELFLADVAALQNRFSITPSHPATVPLPASAASASVLPAMAQATRPQPGVSAALTTVSTAPAAASTPASPPENHSPFVDTFREQHDDALREIISHIENPWDAVALAGTARFLRPPAKEHAAKLLAPKFLEHVVKGEQAEAEKILKRCPEVLLERAVVTDYSGRTFTGITGDEKDNQGITGLQAATWGLDPDMLNMMTPYLDKIEGGRGAALQQIEELETKGLNYHYIGTGTEPERTGSHRYDVALLQKAYQGYIDNFNTWYATQNWKALDNAWLEVGKVQRLLTASLAASYCQAYPFDPTPSEAQIRKPLVRTFNLWDSSWFPLPIAGGGGLGFDFSIAHGADGAWRCSWARGGWRPDWALLVEFAAYSRVCEVRARQVEEFKQSLGQKHPQPEIQELKLQQALADFEVKLNQVISQQPPKKRQFSNQHIVAFMEDLKQITNKHLQPDLLETTFKAFKKTHQALWDSVNNHSQLKGLLLTILSYLYHPLDEQARKQFRNARKLNASSLFFRPFISNFHAIKEVVTVVPGCQAG